MGRKNHNEVKKIAIGGVIAAVVGFLAGILTAPQSGKETRDDIKDTAHKGVDEAEKDFRKLQEEMDNVIRQARANRTKLSKSAQEELNELIDRAKDSKSKAGNVFDAVRNGEAEDRDLDRAIKSASRSLEHLKKYLKK